MQETHDTLSALALICCDTVITDAPTGKKTLVGLFNSIKVARFPYIIGQFFIFASVTNGMGEVPVSVRLSASDGRELFNLKGSLHCKTPLDAPEVVFQIQNMPFTEEGVFDLELIANERIIASRTLTVNLARISH